MSPYAGDASPWQSLQADTIRLYGIFTWRNLLIGVASRRTFRVVATLRCCQISAGGGFLARLTLPVARLLHRVSARRAGIDLPWRTAVAPGLLIIHGWGLVISPGARLGRNISLFHGVTLGRRDRIDPTGNRTIEYPVLEDEVWVGPHAIIVGGVTIGRGSRIAGGAFVTESVPPYSVVSGNPAMIVKSNCIPDVKNPVGDS